MCAISLSPVAGLIERLKTLKYAVDAVAYSPGVTRWFPTLAIGRVTRFVAFFCTGPAWGGRRQII